MSRFFLKLIVLFLSYPLIAQNQRVSMPKPYQNAARAGVYIDVNAAQYPQSSYSIEDLVKNVLISGGACAGTVSNVVVSPNLSASNISRSWGYFNKSTSTFPFDEGVILSTGQANLAGNTRASSTLNGKLNTGTDFDLANALNLPADQFKDATYIQFDFVPNTNKISFEYIFASEEYTGTFACSYTDGFALLLKKINDPTYTNLAVLPNNAGAVSVSNIHHNISGSCAAANEQYFHGLNTHSVETNFTGRTVPLVAEATVIPGETYRFKMVLADFKDDIFDTAVFLKAGSFDLSLHLVDEQGEPLPSSVTMCEGESRTFSANLTVGGFAYQWYHNGSPIPGATNNTYTATQAGVYNLRINSANNSCSESADITVNTIPSPQVNDASISVCESGMTSVFDLTSVQNTISTSQGVTFQYYENQADAMAGNANVITNPTAYTSGSRIVYVRVSNGQCFAVARITLTVGTTPPTPTITASSTHICGNGSVTLSSNVTSGDIIWSNGATTPTITVNTGGTYTVTVSQNGCTSETASITITSSPSAEANDASITLCGSENGIATFDLTSVQNTVSSTQGATFSYYENQADAMAGNTNTIANPTAYTSGSRVVYVRVSNGQCFGVATITLTASATPPTPAITASSTHICGNGSVTLSSNVTSGDIIWSNGATTPTITVNTGGTYTVTVSQNGCTSETASITITKDDDPALHITGALQVCSGSTTLTAVANGNVSSYLWSNGATTSTITVNTSGAYSVTVTTENGCQFEASVTVSVGVTPTVNNHQVAVCSPNATHTFDLTDYESNISTTPNVVFSYYLNQNDAIAGNANTIATPNAYNTTGGTVFVRVSNGDCFAIAELTFEVTQTLTPQIQQSAPVICGTTPVVLTSNYATGNLWSNGATTQSITVTTPGTYTLSVTNGNCTSSPVSVVITQDNDPNVVISGDLTFCQGTSTTLTANTTGTVNAYLWSNGATTPSITVNTPGTYSVTVTTSGGCQFSKSVQVVQENVATINIANPTALNCNVNEVTLQATVTNMPTGATMLWTASNGGNIISGANTLTPTVNQAGTYTLTITNATGLQCSASRSVNVMKDNNPPRIIVTAARTTICEGESVDLIATGAAQYTWNGLTGSGATQTVSPATTTTYTVTGIGANGCPGNIATITINVLPAITSSIADVEFCEGDAVLLDAGFNANYTYKWSTGETTHTVTVSNPGTYWVKISNGACEKTFTIEASYVDTPKISEIVYDAKANTLTVTVEHHSSSLEYSINGGMTWQSSPVFQHIQRNKFYTVSVREQGMNCYSSAEYYTFNLPNVLTPNDDGYNDSIDFTSVSKYPDFQAIIFDRYGKEVFRSSKGNTVWKGKYLNNNVPTGTYWYRVTWKDSLTQKPIESKGWILVKNRE